MVSLNFKLQQPTFTRKMMSFLSIIFFLSSSLTITTLDAQNCKPASCNKSGSPVVRFPFRLTGHQPQSCGYPGYDLSCNNMNQLILNLPSSGEFIVSRIDYITQSIYIVPDFCNMGSINVPINLSTSPFIAPNTRDYIFFNCSSGGASNLFYPLEQLDCISKANATIIAIPASFFYQYINQSSVPSDCNNISTIGFPTQRAAIFLQQDFQLRWGPPFCGRCEARGGTCEFKNDGTLEVQCSKPPTHGLSTAAKYGIIFGVGIPGFLCLICLLNYVRNRIKLYTVLRRNQQTLDLPTTTTVAQRPVFFTMGLDKPTIESYPMIVLGESKRLPKPNDSTCAICLSEYQPKDTLRTVPECLHYFHANCIDAWLMLNATCPVCRNSPEGSSEAHTPSSSISSRTSLFSS